MLNKRMDKVLLVKSAKGFWGFPKGKINEFEEPEDCAAREVLEEVGLEIQSLINRNSIDLALEWPLFILYSVINKSIFWSKY